MLKKTINNWLIINLLIVVFILSCSQKKHKDFPVSKIIRGTYIDKITTNGVLESSNSFNISCPSLHVDMTIIYLIPDGSYVKKGDTVCILECLELENRYNDALKNLETSRSEYNKSKAELDLQYLVLMSQVQTIEATTSISRLDSQQLKFASPVRKQLIELELQKAEIERQKILDQLKFLKKINSAELQKMRLKIKQQERRVDRAKSKLDQLTIVSKIDGIAVRAYIRWRDQKVKEGDIVWNGFPLIQIPDLSQMQIKLSIDESSYKRIEKKQKVDISVDAIPGTKMTGKIKYKEPVGKPIQKDSKVKEFGVIISIDSLAGNLKPGLGATCNIYINEIKDTLIIPSISVFEDDSQNVVFVSNENYFEKRSVNLALNNNNNAIVKSGVFENEYVSLIKPPESLIKNK